MSPETRSKARRVIGVLGWVILGLMAALAFPFAGLTLLFTGSCLTLLYGKVVTLALTVLVFVLLIGGIALPIIGNSRRAVSLKVAGAVCLLLFCLSPFVLRHFFLQGIEANGFSTTVTNPRYYPRLLGQWDKNITGHFPRVIPSDASRVYLYFNRGLRIDAVLQLRYAAPAQQIAALRSHYAPLAVKKYWGDAEEPNDWALLFLYTGDQPVPAGQKNCDAFPKDYEIFVLFSNEHDASGIALSTLCSEVVYWAIECGSG